MKNIYLMLILLIASLSYAQGPNVSSTTGPGGVTASGPRPFYKVDVDPSCENNITTLFSKEVAGEIEIFARKYIGAVCTSIQITTGGVTPVGTVTWLGTTTLAYDGNDMGSLAAANAQCVTDMADVNARVCSDNDVILLIASGSTFGGVTEEVWVHDGTPGYTANANNCASWTDIGTTFFSGYWNLLAIRANLSGCAMSKKYACCK